MVTEHVYEREEDTAPEAEEARGPARGGSPFPAATASPGGSGTQTPLSDVCMPCPYCISGVSSPLTLSRTRPRSPPRSWSPTTRACSPSLHRNTAQSRTRIRTSAAPSAGLSHASPDIPEADPYAARLRGMWGAIRRGALSSISRGTLSSGSRSAVCAEPCGYRLDTCSCR